MFCINCGKELGEEFLFCPSCGKKVNNDNDSGSDENEISLLLQGIEPAYVNYKFDSKKLSSEQLSKVETILEEAKKMIFEKKYVEAEREIDKALEIHPTFEEGYFWIARIREILGRHQEALKYYATALKINPNHSVALNNVGVMFETHFKQRDKAKIFYESALKADCTNTTAEFNLNNLTKPVTTEQEQVIRCSRCGSTNLSTTNQGFGLVKAAAGGLLLGPVGLLGGFLGSNETQIVCLKCGNKWKPGF